jgi:predicted RNA-binding Zn-ribbon protein involved in translation (DUF1610 family)
MGKFKNKLVGFLYGRYGSDTLNKVLTAIYLIWLIVFTVVDVLVKSIIFSIIGWSISLALFFWVIFRMMSRNIYARRRENDKFCGFFKLRRNKFRDRKTHVYRKCKSCKAVLRLHKAKGKHFVVCPKCKSRFEVRG